MVLSNKLDLELQALRGGEKKNQATRERHMLTAFEKDLILGKPGNWNRLIQIPRLYSSTVKSAIPTSS